MNRALILVALLALATASAAVGWEDSEQACDDASTASGLDWRKVSQLRMNLEAFRDLAEQFGKLRLSDREASSRFLVCLNGKKGNRGLAETLMLHESRLQQPKGVEAAFLHYVINTGTKKKPPKLVSEEADLTSLFDQYRESLELIDEDFEYPENLQELREYGRKVNEQRYGREDVVPATLLRPEKRADGYSSRDATWMAELSVLAYWLEKKPPFWHRLWPRPSGDYIRQTRVGAAKQLDGWGYPRVETIFDEKTDTSAFLAVAENSEHLVLAFKGTQGGKDLITDAQLGETWPEWEVQLDFKIHSGFLNALDGVWPQIRKELLRSERQNKPLWVTGHSLGAALAQLAALRMSLDDETRKKVNVRAVYTFGTPRIGDEAFVTAYDSKLGKKTFPHVNHKDLVTRVPPHFGMTAREGGKKFILGPPPEKEAGHELRPLGEEEDLSREDKERLEERAGTLIRNALRFLPEALRPSRSDEKSAPQFPAYSSENEEGAYDEHMSNQYLFKLACCVVAEQLWPIEFEQAGKQVPESKSECRPR